MWTVEPKAHRNRRSPSAEDAPIRLWCPLQRRLPTPCQFCLFCLFSASSHPLFPPSPETSPEHSRLSKNPPIHPRTRSNTEGDSRRSDPARSIPSTVGGCLRRQTDSPPWLSFLSITAVRNGPAPPSRPSRASSLFHLLSGRRRGRCQDAPANHGRAVQQKKRPPSASRTMPSSTSSPTNTRPSTSRRYRTTS